MKKLNFPLFQSSILLLVLSFTLSNCGQSEENIDVTCNDATSLNNGASGECLYASTKNMSLFVKFTGTWCWACGDYGASVVKQAKKYPNDVIVMECHYSNDPMNNRTSSSLIDMWAGSSVPSFMFNGNKAGSAPSSGMVSTVRNADVKAGLASSYTIQGGKVTGKSYVKAMEDLSGKYYLATYLVGDGYVYEQIGKDGTTHPEWEFDKTTETYPNYIHTNICRGEISKQTFAWGTEVTDRGMSTNEVMDVEYSYEIPEDVTEDLKVVVVLWENPSPGNFVFVNAAYGTKQ